MTALPNDPPWLKAAFKDLGLRETPGPKHNARVLEMFRLAGHPEVKNDETAWCSAAANAWLIEGGLRGTGSLMARSWLKFGKAIKTDKLPRGAICVWPRGASKWQGHVNFVTQDTGSRVKCIGGNQSNGVNEQWFNKASLLDARWPNTTRNSRTIKAGITSAVSGTGAETIDHVQPLIDQAQSTLYGVSDYLAMAQYALVALSLIALGYMVYLHVKRLKAPEAE